MNFTRNHRHKLALTVSTALVAFAAGSAVAQTIDVAAPTTAGALNTLIGAETTPDLAVTVDSGVAVTGGTNVTLSSSGAGVLDGDLSFINAGNLGALTGGTVSDVVGLRLSGASPALGTNTATVSNTGLVTNGIQATDFGGDVSITNGGTVYGALIGTGYADVGVINSAGGIVNGNVSVVAAGTLTSPAPVTTGTGPDPVTGDFTSSTTQTQALGGGSASFANAGYVQGAVNVVGSTDVSVTNSGQVTGATVAQAYGSANGERVNTASQVTIPAGTGTVTTVTDNVAEAITVEVVGGNVTGTYSGTNGEVTFISPTQGNITQVASGNSTLSASGTVYGSIDSNAGVTGLFVPFLGSLPANLQYGYSETTVVVTDSADAANNSVTYNEVESETETGVAGTSTVTVSGLVSDYFGSGNVASTGTAGSTVSVSGTVEGNVSSTANGVATSSNERTIDVGRVGSPLVTTLDSDVTTGSVTHTGGAAVGNVTGTGLVDGNLSVVGLSSASAQIDAGATVNGSLTVSTGGVWDDSARRDTTSLNSNVYTADVEADTATRVVKAASTNVASAASGNASATVAGFVNGDVVVSADRGNAAATITGQVDGYVDVAAVGSNYSTSYESQFAGTLASQPLKKTISTAASTATGGTATVTIATSAAQRQQGVGTDTPSVYSVSAEGLGGASVTVGAGSWVAGGVSANSLFNNTASETTATYNANGTVSVSRVSSRTPVGNAASIVNNGVIGGEYYGSDSFAPYAYYGYGDAIATGLTSASVTNNGTAGFLGAYSLTDAGYTETFVDNDSTNTSPSTRTQVTTRVVTPVGGTATVVNTGETNGVGLAGATGTLTNSGKIDGDVDLGYSVANGTFVTTVTSTTTNNPPAVFTPAATLFNQTYTVNQNGKLTGDVYVGGADFYDWDADQSFKTSNVTATINLNTGSETVGSFFGENNTNTVVNVAGGKLTLVGPAFVPASATNQYADWSAGLVGSTGGSFALNVNSGTAQIEPIGYGSKTFGLNGNVTVGANGTLVVGLLNTPVNAGNASSINPATPTVSGANLNVSGNLASTGTIAVGLNGTLVKEWVGTNTTSPDFLAPITTNLSYYGLAYTTPAAAEVNVNSASTVTVGGNLNLGGKLQVYVPRGSIFTGTESQTLFTVGGTIANTATVSSNLNSQFVTLSAATSGQTVVLKATRKSYATAATNPNAAAAAVGLDKAIPGVVKVLVDDASGIRSYSSLAQLSNVQDIANVVSNLDWNLNAAQAGAVFNELASGLIYGSLANVRQNVAFMGQLDHLTQRRGGQAGSVNLWLTPVGNFAKFGGTASGASKIDATSYGAAIGLDIGYGEGGALGFGFGYAKHNVDAQSFPASVDADTYTLGAYMTQAFGPLAVNAKFAYGFSTFDARRDLTMLARTATGHFRGSEWDGSLAVSYALKAGGLDVEPFGELALRHWSMNGFTEEGAAGLGLKVAKAGKTVFNPTLGLRLAGSVDASDAIALRPYANLAYTFQSDAGTARSVGYIGDPAANSFVLNGVNPKGFATLGAGVSALVAGKVNVSLGGSYGFGSSNNVAAIRSAIGIKF